jgi:hypothetical protein
MPVVLLFDKGDNQTQRLNATRLTHYDQDFGGGH